MIKTHDQNSRQRASTLIHLRWFSCFFSRAIAQHVNSDGESKEWLSLASSSFLTNSACFGQKVIRPTEQISVHSSKQVVNPKPQFEPNDKSG